MGFFNGLFKNNYSFEKYLTKSGADPDDKGMMSMKWISELENNLGEI